MFKFEQNRGCIVYFIVETKDQFDCMKPSEECFIQLICGNDNFHPKLSYPSLLYYHDGNKGYMFPFKHSETFSLDLKDVENFLSSHKVIYLLDKKYHSYFLDLKNSVDVNFIRLDQTNSHEFGNCNTILHNNFYSKFHKFPNVNELIPVAKHYEKCQCLYESVKGFFGLEANTDFQNRLISAYASVEKNPIKIDQVKFASKYKFVEENYSKIGEFVLSYYNLYNLTERPTNSFNGINFLAIPKNKDFRECFISSNDYFVEFDFDAYHLRLIGNLIGHEWKNASIHTELGRLYFDKDELTQEEYLESKSITFKQLYGGINPKYIHIDFFAKLESYTEDLWESYKKQRAVALPTGRIIKYSPEMNRLKLFNYLVQNLETVANVSRIERINQYLIDNKLSTKLLLITYDSFLFDFSLKDGKNVLFDIKNILESENMLVKHKYGINYYLNQIN